MLMLAAAVLVALRRGEERQGGERPKGPRPQELAAEEVLQGKVVSVADGDTLRMVVDGREVTVRLEGIDAPERRQAFGNRSRGALAEMVAQRNVSVLSLGLDQFGRTLGIVTVDGENINARLVAEGWAWRYKHSRDEELARLEAEARRERRGLWEDRDPVPPWEFRARERETVERE